MSKRALLALLEDGWSSGKQKFGRLPSQSLQSKCRMEKERIRAAMAMVDGANSSERGSVEKIRRKLLRRRFQDEARNVRRRGVLWSIPSQNLEIKESHIRRCGHLSVLGDHRLIRIYAKAVGVTWGAMENPILFRIKHSKCLRVSIRKSLKPTYCVRAVRCYEVSRLRLRR